MGSLSWGKLIILGLLLLSVGGAQAHFELVPQDSKILNSSGSRDFFIFKTKISNLRTQKNKSLESCRENILKVICLVTPLQDGQSVEDRECLSGGEAYAVYFENLYDHYPPALQKMFCSLDYIFIEKEFIGTAYAGQLVDENGQMYGGILGIRQSVLDNNLDLATWATWKEQLSFGGVVDSYTLTSNLPHIQTQSQTKANDFLYFVIAHEFGHIFDFANKLNSMVNCGNSNGNIDDPECDMSPDSWGGISWLTNHKPKPVNDFFNLSSLCFYWCNGNALALGDVPQVYRDLAPTEFISIYATSQPWDDFADSLAYFVMAQNLNTTYVVDTKQGVNYDIIQKLKSPVFAKKYHYIDQFLKRTDIVYP